MIQIHNLADLMLDSKILLLADEAVDQILINIATAARNEWIKLAGQELHSSRAQYVKGIQGIRFTPGRAVITLVGDFPNSIESGMDARDMHDTLLGPKVPVVPPGQRGKHPRKAGGFYRIIPFRHRTGGGGATMGNPYNGHAAVADSRKLGREVYEAAKQLAGTTSEPGQGVTYGGRLPAGLAPKLKAYHATDIFAGMVRSAKTYAKATQSQYHTFRVISVDASGAPVGKSPWIRPRTPGKHLADKVGKFIETLAPQAMEAYIEGAK